MEQMQTAIILLSVLVGLLSVVIVALMAVVIALLIKIRNIAKTVDTVTANMARATEWLSPTKVFGEIGKLFRK